MATHHATSLKHLWNRLNPSMSFNIIHHTETYTFRRSRMCFTDSWSHWVSLVVVELPCRSLLNIFMDHLGIHDHPSHIRYVYSNLFNGYMQRKTMKNICCKTNHSIRRFFKVHGVHSWQCYSTLQCYYSATTVLLQCYYSATVCDNYILWYIMIMTMMWQLCATAALLCYNVLQDVMCLPNHCP